MTNRIQRIHCLDQTLQRRLLISGEEENQPEDDSIEVSFSDKFAELLLRNVRSTHEVPRDENKAVDSSLTPCSPDKKKVISEMQDTLFIDCS